MAPHPIKLGQDSTLDKQVITINGYLFARSPRNGKFTLVRNAVPKQSVFTQKSASMSQTQDFISVN